MKSISREEVPKEGNDDLSQDLLSIFWDLASIDENKRVERVVDLLTILKSKIENFEDTNEKSIPEELTYTVKRLVKGAGSSRKGVRQGFGTALAEILKNFTEIKYDRIFELMDEHLTVKKSFEAQEERDALFGCAFCHAAMIQALSSDMENFGKYVAMTVEKLFALMKKKSYLLELCTKLIIDVLEKIDENCFTKTVFPILKVELKEGWDKCTPEKLCILLVVEKLFKGSVGTYFKSSWDCSKILEKKNMEKIAKILKESTVNSHPRMHLVWSEVLPPILENNKVLKAFWETVIEDTLMQSTHERKFLAFNVLQEVLAKISKSQVEIVISERIMKSIINNCNSEKNYLYTASRNLLDSFPSQIGKNDKEGLALETIHQIIQKSGTLSFDVLTKTKTIENLIGRLDSSSISSFISWLKKIFLSGKVEEIIDNPEVVEEENIAYIRKWAASQLLVVVRSSNLVKDETWMLEIGKFLFFHGHFKAIKKKSKIEHCVLLDPPVDESTSAICRERFLGVLSELSHFSQHSQDCATAKSGLSSIPGSLKNGDYFAYEFVKFVQELLEDSKHISLKNEWTEEAKETFDDGVQIVNDIRDKVPRSSSMSEDRAFELLFLHSCLQMFDKTDEAADVIQELMQCFKKLKEKKKKKKSVEEPHWSEVLTEILLSFLAQSSHMMRQIVNMVFTIILPHITHDAFLLIIEALKPKKSASESGLEMINDSDEDNEMIEHENGSDDDDEDDDDENDNAATKDLTDTSDDESEKDVEIDSAFRSEIKVALGEAAVDTDQSEDEDENEKEDSDVDMDTVDPKILDSMDKALAAAFKTRMLARSGLKKKQEEKKAIVHFRSRVLDIVELIVKKQPKSPLILDLIEPLLEVIQVSSMYKEEKELHDRSQGILKNRICHAREIPNGEDVDKERVHLKIEDLIRLAQNASSMQMVNLITLSCMFLIRVLRGKDDIKEPSPLKTRNQRQKENESKNDTELGSINCQRIVNIFQLALDDFMTRRNSHLQPIVFLELIKRYPTIAWKLSSSLALYISKAVNNFRKAQACEMILQLLARKAQCKDDDFQAMAIPLQQELTKVFQQASEENFAMKAKHLHEIAKLTDKFAKEYKSTLNLAFDEQLVISIKNAVEGPIMKRSPQLMAYCKRIIILLSGQGGVDEDSKKRKRKNVLEEGDEGDCNGAEGEVKKDSTEEVSEKNRKKKKKRKENK